MKHSPKVLVGVCGGIAAYKAVRVGAGVTAQRR